MESVENMQVSNENCKNLENFISKSKTGRIQVHIFQENKLATLKKVNTEKSKQTTANKQKIFVNKSIKTLAKKRFHANSCDLTKNSKN